MQCQHACKRASNARPCHLAPIRVALGESSYPAIRSSLSCHLQSLAAAQLFATSSPTLFACTSLPPPAPIAVGPRVCPAGMCCPGWKDLMNVSLGSIITSVFSDLSFCVARAYRLRLNDRRAFPGMCGRCRLVGLLAYSKNLARILSAPSFFLLAYLPSYIPIEVPVSPTYLFM
eukprot:3123138-Pleurochrysis_carterae.AAC.2